MKNEEINKYLNERTYGIFNKTTQYKKYFSQEPLLTTMLITFNTVLILLLGPPNTISVLLSIIFVIWPACHSILYFANITQGKSEE